MRANVLTIACLAAITLIALPLTSAGREESQGVIKVKDAGIIAAPRLESSGYPCQLTMYNGFAYHPLPVDTDSTSLVQYFDPEDCGYDPTYPFAITSLAFSLYDSLGAWNWPVTVKVVVYDMADSSDVCAGPGIRLSHFPVICDSATYEYPKVGVASFPTPCAVSRPFFIGIEYADGAAGPYPAIIFDSNPSRDSCHVCIRDPLTLPDWETLPNSFIGYPMWWVNGQADSASGINIWLDCVDGLVDGQIPMNSSPVTFHFSYRNFDPNNKVKGISNGYELSATGGVIWTPGPYGDEFIWGPAGNNFDLAWLMNTFSLDGLWADTIGFSGSTMSGPGLPPGYNSFAVYMTIRIAYDSSYDGKQFCIDSAWFPPGGAWQWAYGSSIGSITPSWAGPYCFEIRPEVPPESCEWEYSAFPVVPGGYMQVTYDPVVIHCDTVGGLVFNGYVYSDSAYSGPISAMATAIQMAFTWDHPCQNIDNAEFAVPVYTGGQWSLDRITEWMSDNIELGSALQLPFTGDSSGNVQVVYYAVDLGQFYANQPPLLSEYSVIDGLCSDLPGYLIGTTPTQFNPHAPPSGNPFSTTPLTGTLVAHGAFGFDVTTCCMGSIRGNVDFDQGDLITISDLVYLVDYMFNDGPAPLCIDEADIDALGGQAPVDIADQVHLVDYMFNNGPPPVACQ